ncbi:MAG TPA: EAL domain-containing protein, partial [Acidimicrobiales bacterium]|nr:EAL domain-containing protein [Acidimicrobiales bacterium]
TIGYGEATITNMLDHPDVGGFLLVVADRSDQRELEDRLRHRAEHDALTGLANRAALADALEARLDAGEQPAVVLLDLDGFKGLNDSLGHVAGDQLLRVVANRLRAAVRPTDVVARLGGDEFAVVVDGGHQDAFDVATRITERLDEQVAVLGRVVRCRASVGVTTIGSSADELIRNADLAMYEAKAGGRNRVEVFEDRLHQRLVRRMRLEEALAHAVDRNELRLVHQPVVDLETGRLLGAEALLRWRHAGEEIEPSEFVPLAEETGLITSIGRWVLREACAAAARWHRLRPDGPPPRVAVNVSALQLGSGTLVTDVADALTAARLSPSCLTIEITESAVMARSEEIVGRLSALRAVGVRVSIDDFGTGHSSLGRLRFLPVDEVKIDRSFVSGAGDAVDIAVVEAVLALAGSLGLEVVAEGIETRDQLDALRLRGCEMGQGWLFGAGVPSSGIERLLLDEVDNRTLNFSV